MQCKSYSHFFFSKNIRILCIESAKTVNEITLNELVKLTTLKTTGPWKIVSGIEFAKDYAGGGGGGGLLQHCKLQCCHMKSLSETETSIFVLLCVRCFQRQLS